MKNIKTSTELHEKIKAAKAEMRKNGRNYHNRQDDIPADGLDLGPTNDIEYQKLIKKFDVPVITIKKFYKLMPNGIRFGGECGANSNR